jgi:hypothetical protein
MKFIKGSFTVVPNLDRIVCLPPSVQTAFFWICVHADGQGVCFPTRKKLAFECGMTIKMLDKSLKILETAGIIMKTQRKKIGSKENTSNVYQIILSQFDVEVAPAPAPAQVPALAPTATLQVAPIETPPSSHSDPTGSPHSDPETISNINYTQLTTEEKKEIKKDNSENELIEHFKYVNEFHNSIFRNKTERKSLSVLMEKKGKEKIIKVIDLACFSETDIFFPKFRTPYELETKWTKIQDFWKRKVKFDPKFKKEFEEFTIKKYDDPSKEKRKITVNLMGTKRTYEIST